MYNSKNTKQKYTYTIKVLKKGKLTKNDFVFKDKSTGKNLNALDRFKAFSSLQGVYFTNNLKNYETYRGINYLDSYSKVCERNGKKSLTAVTSKDPFYKQFTSDFRYYVTYSYNSQYKLRMYFNLQQKLVGVVWGRNLW